MEVMATYLKTEERVKKDQTGKYKISKYYAEDQCAVIDVFGDAPVGVVNGDACCLVCSVNWLSKKVNVDKVLVI